MPSASRHQAKILLIGLGYIARHHALGIQASECFRLCGVCDLRKEAATEPLFSAFPFSTDYKRLIESLRPDIAVVATPPSSHRVIAEECIKRGVHVFVEKPLSNNADDSAFFFSPAALGNYTPVCHTLFGEEALWFAQNVQLSKIKSVSMSFSDPYADSAGVIRPERLPLGGCWLDSAPNALALLSQWLPPEQLQKVSVIHREDKLSGLPYSSCLQARAEEATVSIEIRWDKGEDSKQTIIRDDEHEYMLDHSAQAVWQDGKQCYAYDGGERLTRHYTNFYRIINPVEVGVMTGLTEPMGVGVKTRISEQRVPTTETLKAIYNLIYINS